MKSATGFMSLPIPKDPSLYVSEATQPYLFFVHSVSPIVGRAQKLYIWRPQQRLLYSQRDIASRCAASNVGKITRVRRVNKSKGGVVYRHTQWPLRAIASAAFSLAAFLLEPCLANSSRRSTPHPVREINAIQQAIGRSFSHKLLEVMVSTTRARREHDKVFLPGVQTKTGRWGSPPVWTTSQDIHWPSFSFTWGKYPRCFVGGSKTILAPRS